MIETISPGWAIGVNVIYSLAPLFLIGHTIILIKFCAEANKNNEKQQSCNDYIPDCCQAPYLSRYKNRMLRPVYCELYKLGK